MTGYTYVSCRWWGWQWCVCWRRKRETEDRRRRRREKKGNAAMTSELARLLRALGAWVKGNFSFIMRVCVCRGLFQGAVRSVARSERQLSSHCRTSHTFTEFSIRFALLSACACSFHYQGKTHKREKRLMRNAITTECGIASKGYIWYMAIKALPPATTTDYTVDTHSIIKFYSYSFESSPVTVHHLLEGGNSRDIRPMLCSLLLRTCYFFNRQKVGWSYY